MDEKPKRHVPLMRNIHGNMLSFAITTIVAISPINSHGAGIQPPMPEISIKDRVAKIRDRLKQGEGATIAQDGHDLRGNLVAQWDNWNNWRNS